MTLRISQRSSTDGKIWRFTVWQPCMAQQIETNHNTHRKCANAREREGEKVRGREKKINGFCECQHWHWHRIKAFLIRYLPENSISYLFAHQNLRMALIFPYEIPLYIIRLACVGFSVPNVRTHTLMLTSDRAHASSSREQSKPHFNCIEHVALRWDREIDRKIR